MGPKAQRESGVTRSAESGRGARAGSRPGLFAGNAAGAALAGSVLLAALLAGVTSPVAAQTSSVVRVGAYDGQITRKIDMFAGKSVVVELPRDAKEVIIGNPKVANAVVRSPRQIYLLSADPGLSSLIVLDAEGQQIASFDLTVSKDMSPIIHALRQALPGRPIEVKPLGDGVLITGAVNSSLEAAQAADVAAKFTGGSDKVSNALSIRTGDQVMLKVTVAEVERSVVKRLGIVLGPNSWNIGSTVLNWNSNPGISDPLGSINPVFDSGGSLQTSVDLRALERNGIVRVLAEPTVTAISGESAKFLAGGEVPIVSGETCDPLTGVCNVTYTYRELGVVLNFTPIVLGDGRISLKVETGVSELSNENKQTLRSGGELLSIRSRQANTTVELPSGSSLVLAGLIQEASKQTIEGMPGLKQLPVIGALFRSRDYQRKETELMIMVTPYLAKPVARRDLSLPTDGFADSSDGSAVFMGRLHRIYGVVGDKVPPGTFHGKPGFIID